MKHLLNTLYITSPNKYLSLEGENVVILENQEEIGRITQSSGNNNFWVHRGKSGINGHVCTKKY